MDIQSIKNRFGIIGNSPALNFALQVAAQVSNTDLTVLIAGESGVGKEAFSVIIHSLSARKHNPFIAVNCGAIPEGTIDSELFGHEKGSFTGAADARKEAQQRGWERRRCADRPYRPQIDICPACIGEPIPNPLWFQDPQREPSDG